MAYPRRSLEESGSSGGRSAAALARVRLAAAAFFLSGAAALIYQVCWQRILALHTGVGLYSITLIVGAFMTGLGLGSWLGGERSARLTPRDAMRAFVGIELGIAAFGAASGYLYYDWLYGSSIPQRLPPALAGLLHFAVLLPPTFLMGMSLPFLADALVEEPGRAREVLGVLYGLNTAGASLGALVTPWVLLRYGGVRGALLAAAAANLAAAWVGSRLLGAWPPAAPGVEVPFAAAPAERRPFPVWVVLYAVSGFCALSLEIVWFRVVDVAARATAFTFGTVLSVYLLGFGAGALAASRPRLRVERPLRAFLACQSALLAYAAFGAVALSALPPTLPVLRDLYAYWSSHEMFRIDATLYLLLPALLYLPATFLMGFSFPMLQRAVHEEARGVGRRVGYLQAANILGCLVGSVLTGLVLIDRWGTTGALRALLVTALVFPAAGAVWCRPRRSFVAWAALLVAMAVAVPSQEAFWFRLHGASPPTLIREDATGVVVLRPDGEDWSMLVNGKANSTLPFRGVHMALGAMPVIIHPAPRDVAIIGLGSGDTAWSAGCREEVRNLVVFELARGEWSLLRDLAARPGAPTGLLSFLTDPRYSIRVEDGRNAIDRGGADWDVIETDALHPPSAYSSYVFSVEFFARSGARLRKGGLMCTWNPTPRVDASFRRVFRYVVEGMWNGAVLVGSHEPIPLDRDRWRRRATSEAVTSYLGGDRAREIVGRCIDTARLGDPTPNDAAETNRDLFPRDEFRTPPAATP